LAPCISSAWWAVSSCMRIDNRSNAPLWYRFWLFLGEAFAQDLGTSVKPFPFSWSRVLVSHYFVFGNNSPAWVSLTGRYLWSTRWRRRRRQGGSRDAYKEMWFKRYGNTKLSRINSIGHCTSSKRNAYNWPQVLPGNRRLEGSGSLYHKYRDVKMCGSHVYPDL
jgi:hypothetical protein